MASKLALTRNVLGRLLIVAVVKASETKPGDKTKSNFEEIIKKTLKPVEPDLRIVLVGRNGAGKSATGNTILRKKVFQSNSSSLTVKCQKETAWFGCRKVAVVDTPDVFDTTKKTEITKCVSFAAPGPHAFLVVIHPNTFKDEEEKMVKRIQEVYGEGAASYTMALFTCGDQLEEEGKRIEDKIVQNKTLCDLVSQCKGGYHVFNFSDSHPSQVCWLLEKIETMIKDNGGSYYTNEMLQEAERAIEDQKERLLRENRDMNPEEARKRAEEDNAFIQYAETNVVGLVTEAAVFAGLAAVIGGAVAGPHGAVVGAVVGAAMGAVTKKYTG